MNVACQRVPFLHSFSQIVSTDHHRDHHHGHHFNNQDSSEEAPGGGRSGAVTVKCHTCAKEFGKVGALFVFVFVFVFVFYFLYPDPDWP